MSRYGIFSHMKWCLFNYDMVKYVEKSDILVNYL